MVNGRRSSVVVGVDGSKDGLIALDWAAGHARLHGTGVRVVHVVDSSDPVANLVPRPPWMPTTPDDGSEVLADAADELRRLDEVPAKFELLRGHPAQVLLAAGRESGLLVVGRRGLEGFGELVIGSTSQICVALAESPVVVVPDRWHPDAPTAGRVVVGVDGSADCRAALRFAFDEAARRDAGLVALHAVKLPEAFPPADLWIEPEPPRWSDEVEQAVAESLAWCARHHPDVPVERRLVVGHPVQALAKISASADLVVVGGRGRSAFTGLLLGSVARGLVHHSACPVAVIHERTEQLTEDR